MLTVHNLSFLLDRVVGKLPWICPAMRCLNSGVSNPMVKNMQHDKKIAMFSSLFRSQHVSSDFLFSLRCCWASGHTWSVELRSGFCFRYDAPHDIAWIGEYRPSSSIRPTRYGAQVVGIGLRGFLLWRVLRTLFMFMVGLWGEGGRRGYVLYANRRKWKPVVAYCGGHLIIERGHASISYFCDHEWRE